jgi:hypothetical protein
MPLTHTCSQVTKLCDLSPSDSVTSVAWSQRGSYISVGCSAGKVSGGCVCSCAACRANMCGTLLTLLPSSVSEL